MGDDIIYTYIYTHVYMYFIFYICVHMCVYAHTEKRLVSKIYKQPSQI